MREDGAIIIDGIQTASTLCCVHCGAHWVPQPGSGTVRGFCRNCMGPVCGPRCRECVPMGKWLDTIERESKMAVSIRG